MTLSDGWACVRVLQQGWTVGGLAALVMIWWLFIAAVVVQISSGPPVLAASVGMGLVPGQTARTFLQGMSWLPIPVERAAFDEYQRGARESDEDAMEHAFTANAWIRIAHHDAVRVITVDGEAVQIELLEGGFAGHRGWLKLRQLLP
jgi:hypothetical protein